jgi:predicted kinase
MGKSNRKPTAHLICGFIGSGKSTFAKKLEKETGSVRFTKDEWVIRIFGHDPKKIDRFGKYDDRIVKLVTDVALECLSAGCNVIIDDGFWSRLQRKEIYGRITKLGANYILYYVKCPDAVSKQQTLQRSKNLSKDSFIIDEDMYNSYKKYFEAPTEDENPIVIENGKVIFPI